MKMRNIGRLVKCPGLRHAEAIEIDAPNGFAERQNAVEKMERKSQNLARVGVGAMMGVVKQRTESKFRLVGQDCSPRSPDPSIRE